MNNLINCHACGEQNPTTAKFCKGCGVKLEVAPPQDEPMVEANAQPEWSASQMAVSAPATADTRDDSLARLQQEMDRRKVSSPATTDTRDDTLAAHKHASAISPQPDYAASAFAAREYTALRGIANLCRALSWIAVGLAALQALGGLWLMTESFFSGFAIIVAAALGGGLVYILLQVIAESISVLLDIEANTRRAANVLEQRWQ